MKHRNSHNDWTKEWGLDTASTRAAAGTTGPFIRNNYTVHTPVGQFFLPVFKNNCYTL